VLLSRRTGPLVRGFGIQIPGAPSHCRGPVRARRGLRLAGASRRTSPRALRGPQRSWQRGPRARCQRGGPGGPPARARRSVVCLT